MNLLREPYQTQRARWPQAGCHILAQFDETSIIVYQAYRPSIGHFAAQHGYFGGEFSFERMSWIKPNFLWMMYRCGWAKKPGQEVVLAVRLKRPDFESLLAQAVHSTYHEKIYANEETWKWDLKHSSVRLQWDPDHDPAGTPIERRAIQLGLRDGVLAHYARKWVLEIEDISDFVREQHRSLQKGDYTQLMVPREEVYPLTDPVVAARVGITPS